MSGAEVRLFSYGTLQQPEVQLASYGRLIDAEPDALLGYELQPLLIENPRVVALSGKAVHMIARRTADETARITGALLLLTETELQASDAYEDRSYTRVEVTLESGRTAFVYVGEPAL
jgi:gamma-glutamylcyclotransferase (GGCT)/AIG2-like uncharacterized protein YtfP